jgi:hypothetical protein
MMVTMAAFRPVVRNVAPSRLGAMPSVALIHPATLSAPALQSENLMPVFGNSQPDHPVCLAIEVVDIPYHSNGCLASPPLSRERLFGGDIGFNTRVRWVSVAERQRHRPRTAFEDMTHARELENAVRSCAKRTRKHGSVARASNIRKQRGEKKHTSSFIPLAFDVAKLFFILSCIWLFECEAGIHVPITTCMFMMVMLICAACGISCRNVAHNVCTFCMLLLLFMGLTETFVALILMPIILIATVAALFGASIVQTCYHNIYAIVSVVTHAGISYVLLIWSAMVSEPAYDVPDALQVCMVIIITYAPSCCFTLRNISQSGSFPLHTHNFALLVCVCMFLSEPVFCAPIIPACALLIYFGPIIIYTALTCFSSGILYLIESLLCFTVILIRLPVMVFNFITSMCRASYYPCHDHLPTIFLCVMLHDRIHTPMIIALGSAFAVCILSRNAYRTCPKFSTVNAAPPCKIRYTNDHPRTPSKKNKPCKFQGFNVSLLAASHRAEDTRPLPIKIHETQIVKNVHRKRRLVKPQSGFLFYQTVKYACMSDKPVVHFHTQPCGKSSHIQVGALHTTAKDAQAKKVN